MNVHSTCQAGSLTFSDGLAVLLHRKLDALRPGQVLGIQSGDPSIVHDLRAWTRLTGHRLIDVHQENGDVSCRVERGNVQRVIAASAADWGNRATISDGRFDTRSMVIGAASRIPQHADPETGFSPRGSVVEKGSPAYPFDVLDAGKAWTSESADLYEQASAGHWNASTDIPWT